MLQFILTLCIGLLFATAAQAEITAENAFDFLRLGEGRADIFVSPDNIDWIEDEEAAAERIVRLKAALVRNPRNLSAALELIELYDRGCRETEAKEIANRTLSAFKERFDRDRDETSALRFAKAALAAKARNEYEAAYRALQPVLESGRARRETCVSAIKIIMEAGDYGPAKRIADLCIRIYPRFAELYYLRYCISIANSLLNAITEAVQLSSREFLDERKKFSLEMADLGEFIVRCLGDLSSNIDRQSLFRATELEPANYKYALARPLYEAWSFLVIKAFLKSFSEHIDDERLEELFRQYKAALLPLLREHLKEAEDNRPKRDIQVYLACVMANMIYDEYDEAESYGLLAVETRPDLPEGYDALILNTFASFLFGDENITPEMNEKAIAIYKDKIDHVGASASDYFGIAGLYFSQYGEADNDAGSPVLERTKHYTEKALELDPRFIPGLMLLANYHIVLKEYRPALAILADIPKPEDPDLQGAILHNLGIARVLAGDREAGIAALREALALQPRNQDTQDALRKLGVDQGKHQNR